MGKDKPKKEDEPANAGRKDMPDDKAKRKEKEKEDKKAAAKQKKEDEKKKKDDKQTKTAKAAPAPAATSRRPRRARHVPQAVRQSQVFIGRSRIFNQRVV